MKAIVTEKYGSPDVLQLAEVEKPTPRDDEVLVRVHVAAVNAGDWHLLRADPFIVRFFFGLTRPKSPILGSDVAGTVEAVGTGVEGFEIGDEVFGDLSNCGFGAFAEYVCVPAKALARKPANASFEETAALPISAVTALQGLRDHGKIQAGQKVLINGASGGVGTYAVQLAKAFGAHVTAVCSTAKVDMVRELGADRVIDYTQEDFAAEGEQYDLILAANGERSIFDYKRALKPGGTYVMSGGAGSQMFQAMVLGPIVSLGSGKRITNFIQASNTEDLEVLKELVESGKLEPVIDRELPLESVPDGLRYVEAGHARGKVIIKVR